MFPQIRDSTASLRFPLCFGTFFPVEALFEDGLKGRVPLLPGKRSLLMEKTGNAEEAFRIYEQMLFDASRMNSAFKRSEREWLKIARRRISARKHGTDK